MELILWRHADAADGSPDLARPLTQRGQKQARAMAEWLNGRLAADTRVLASPARRAQETAQALGRPFETIDDIAPDAEPAAVIAAAGWPDAKTPALVVGHQPTLGLIAAQLLGADRGEMSVRKGAIVWIRSPRRSVWESAKLVLVMEPEKL